MSTAKVSRMRSLRAVALACLLVLLVAVPASAAVVATGPGGFVAGFLPPVVVIEEGEGITYANVDVAPHDFVADGHFIPKKAARKVKWCSGFDPGKCPLFWSPKIGAGETTEVEGLERLTSGDQYNFLCTVHPNMKGTLVVR